MSSLGSLEGAGRSSSVIRASSALRSAYNARRWGSPSTARSSAARPAASAMRCRQGRSASLPVGKCPFVAKGRVRNAGTLSLNLDYCVAVVVADNAFDTGLDVLRVHREGAWALTDGPVGV